MSLFHRPDDETLRRQGIDPAEYTGLLIQFWLVILVIAAFTVGLVLMGLGRYA